MITSSPAADRTTEQDRPTVQPTSRPRGDSWQPQKQSPVCHVHRSWHLSNVGSTTYMHASTEGHGHPTGSTQTSPCTCTTCNTCCIHRISRVHVMTWSTHCHVHRSCYGKGHSYKTSIASSFLTGATRISSISAQHRPLPSTAIPCPGKRLDSPGSSGRGHHLHISRRFQFGLTERTALPFRSGFRFGLGSGRRGAPWPACIQAGAPAARAPLAPCPEPPLPVRAH